MGIFLKAEVAENNDLVAVSSNGDDVTLKRYVKLDGHVLLKPESFNVEHQIKAFAPTELSRFRVIGKLLIAVMSFTQF